MARGARRAGDEVLAQACPIADGGEGTLDVLAAAMGAALFARRVTGPLGESVEASFGWLPRSRTAIVELATAAGLSLAPRERRDPTKTTTYGVGELIRHAARHGASSVLVAVGGSATVDGGCGMAQALGAKFFDERGALIEPPITGGMLEKIARIEPPTWSLPRIDVLCDVTNPLLGPDGAARTYAPQKGATPAQVEELERGLAHLAKVTGGDANAEGAGAAGGAAFGLMAICGATLRRGIEVVLDAIDVRAAMVGANLMLTGEGRLDGQSLHGKAVSSIARVAHGRGVPTIAIVGSAGPDAASMTDRQRGGYLHSYVALADEFGEERSMREAAALVERVAERVVRGVMRG